MLPAQMQTKANRERLAREGIQWVSSSSDRGYALLAKAGRRLNPLAPCVTAPCVRHAIAWKADLVVVSQAACWGAYRELLGLRSAGIKYVSISQLNTPFVWPGDALFECVGDAFAAAQSAVFVSQGNLALFQNQVARILPNATVIYNPPSFAIDRPCEPPASHDGMVLLNVARIDPNQKGQDLIVDVLSMPKWRERDVHVRIAGGGNASWFKKLLASKNLSSVSVLGHVTDLRTEWEKCTFGLFPSRFEGMPLAMVEGMALGRAVIATDVGGHREWIDEGRSGFLAMGAEPAALDWAFEQAWNARTGAGAMGATARGIYESRTVIPPAEQFAQVIESALAKPAGPPP
jgi:glycosyltransferase involved in cell wall biosynthesis